jgi:hypothetical protein
VKELETIDPRAPYLQITEDTHVAGDIVLYDGYLNIAKGVTLIVDGNVNCSRSYIWNDGRFEVAGDVFAGSYYQNNGMDKIGGRKPHECRGNGYERSSSGSSPSSGSSSDGDLFNLENVMVAGLLLS